jgi:hypothetical protein
MLINISIEKITKDMKKKILPSTFQAFAAWESGSGKLLPEVEAADSEANGFIKKVEVPFPGWQLLDDPDDPGCAKRVASSQTLGPGKT